MDSALSEVVGSLESALLVVQEKKAVMDDAVARATAATQEYQTAVKAAQAAHAAYSGHVNTIMAGFAQLHQ